MKHRLSKRTVWTLSVLLLSTSSLVALASKVFQVDVKMVMVSFTVKDESGRYVSGLTPKDISLREDNLSQQIASFNESGTALTGTESTAAQARGASNSIFILFDTSNCMYDGFARAEDEIAEFIRGLDGGQAVAIYSFSHNMTRLQRLTTDHEHAVRALRTASAGDSTAVLNATLLALRDAAQVPDRKMVVVFSNRPDDTSVVSPSDVARVAEDEGIPVDIIATKNPGPVCRSAFELLADSAGGQLFLADTSALQAQAFRDIGEDLKHTYTLTYYPAPNPNIGWRHIAIKVLPNSSNRYRICARGGYWPHHQEEISQRSTSHDREDAGGGAR